MTHHLDEFELLNFEGEAFELIVACEPMLDLEDLEHLIYLVDFEKRDEMLHEIWSRFMENWQEFHAQAIALSDVVDFLTEHIRRLQADARVTRSPSTCPNAGIRE